MKTILILEDDVAVRGLLVQIATKVNPDIHILQASSSEEAFEKAHEAVVDLFFLDVRLPDYSGIILAKKLRIIPDYQITPIVFITADPTQELKAYRQSHCFDYIIKSLDLRKIEEAFKTFLLSPNKEIKPLESIVLNCKTHSFVVKFEDILFVEYYNRKTSFITSDNKIECAKSLKEIALVLPKDFLQVNRSYIVNQSYIDKINHSESIIYIRDYEIPIGRTYRKDVKVTLDKTFIP